jgi:Transposase DDE domain/Domain of unknown function (DUF4372)
MNSGRFVLSQVLDQVHRQALERCAQRYNANDRVRHFGCRQQFTAMAFAQMTWREGLRDIEACLNAKPEALYHLGFSEPIARSTLADANEGRDWRLWRDLAVGLIAKARRLYVHEDLGLQLANTVYALDSTTIDLSLSLFGWADFRSTKAGVKLHTQLDLRGPIPTVIDITPARKHDVLWLDELLFEAGAFYVMDRGYMDFVRLAGLAASGAFFVTRAKDNLRFTRHRSLPVNHEEGLRSDHLGKLTLAKAREAFPWPLRRVRYFDAESRRDLIFLSNHLEISGLTVARLYKLRWQVELFFRWIKQHLRLKHFYGNSPNAVKTQIWIAVAVYVMVAILHKELQLPGTLHRTLQILSVHPFEKVPLHELLTQTDPQSYLTLHSNQLMLWDL